MSHRRDKKCTEICGGKLSGKQAFEEQRRQENNNEMNRTHSSALGNEQQ
jgi:hypothetical protein